MPPPPTSILVAAVVMALYGLAAIGFGIAGYAAAGSRVSLFAGGAAGVVLLICAVFAWRASWWPLAVGILVSLLLIGRFSPSLFKAPSLADHVGTLAGRCDITMVLGGVLVLIAAVIALLNQPRTPV